jgi:hypothetical protein
MKRSVPPRLHVVLARDSKSAVVFRRGPSRYTATIGWDRKTDQFQVGQWLHGRIYERRADLSPDGKHLIYFAMNGRWSSAVKGSWTAISRAPYLKAVSLYAKGDCWHGGGLFLSRNEFWLNDGYGHEPHEEDPRLLRSLTYPWHEHYGGECLGVYFVRLQRDGWAMKCTSPDENGGQTTVFEKRVSGHWLLRKHAHATSDHPVGRGVYFDTHELVNVRTHESVSKEAWEWADVDGDRIVWAAAGCISAGRLEAKGVRQERTLFDFSSLQPERIAAPY